MKCQAAFLVASFAMTGMVALGHQKPSRAAPTPVVLEMRGRKILVDRHIPAQRAKKPAKSKRRPTGWQPGGPLRPLYQSAVRAIHERNFNRAESMCRQGLVLAKGDKAFADLLGQIPAWRRDTTLARITGLYKSAVDLVHRQLFDDAEAKCREGLAIEPGNQSFRDLQADIASLRHDLLESKLVQAYRQASELMSQGRLDEAEARCREGLKLQPDDAVLTSLLRRIQAHRR